MPTDLVARLKKLLLACTVFKSKPTETISLTASHLGGIPYLQAGETWPACTSCRAPLSFIGQINAKDCKARFPGHAKLFTFFYCWNCYPFEGPPGSWSLNTYDNPHDKKNADLKDQSPQPTNLCALVPSGGQSLPNWEGIDAFDENVTEIAQALDKEPWEAFNAAVKALGAIDDLTTQAGGYPRWLQGDDTPECDQCHEPMSLLAQFDSNDDAGIMWGDVGLAYIFSCRAHPKERRLVCQCC